MKYRILFFTIFLVAVCSRVFGQDRLLGVLKTELKQQMDILQGEKIPPYYMSFQVVNRWSNTISASFGAISNTEQSRVCRLVPQIRVGDMILDNFAASDMGSPKSFSGQHPSARLPILGEDMEQAILEAIRNDVNPRYQFALKNYQFAKNQKSVNVATGDQAPWFSKVPVQKYYEAPFLEDRLTVNKEMWKKRMREVTAVFNDYPYLLSGAATFDYSMERRYFLNTEGTEVVENLPCARIVVYANTKANDGVNLPLRLSYFAFDPKDLPDNERIIVDIRNMAVTLKELRDAPVVDPYSGPVLFSGAAGAVFFQNIFGYRVEGQRMKRDGDGQTFKKMIGERVLPESMQVYDDPTLPKYGEACLNGFYKFDDQGVKAERVTVVKDGKLNDFLMTRTPIDGFSRSNGHARVDFDGKDPVSRQSNLIVETKDHKTEAELRALFVTELKKQGKEYGYFFKEVTSGSSFTDTRQINSFNVQPLVVYRVFADGRPDQLVRGANIIGTPLAMFSNIQYAGGKSEIFTGKSEAESGNIWVTVACPMIFVQKVEIQQQAKPGTTLPILPDPISRKQ